MRRLRVLSDHPHVPGKPGDYIEEFEGAQAYVDVGIVEWAPEERAVPVETTEADPPPETAVTRPSARGRSRTRQDVGANQVHRA